MKQLDQKLQAMEESSPQKAGLRQKYVDKRAKLMAVKKGQEMRDSEWVQVVAVFVCRMEGIVAKDKKFLIKAQKALEEILPKFKIFDIRRKKAPRSLPKTRKDFEFENIAHYKRQQKEKKLKALMKAKERDQENRERLEMKMEDYNVEIQKKVEESEELSEDVSIGGVSMYIYKESADATPLPQSVVASGLRVSKEL